MFKVLRHDRSGNVMPLAAVAMVCLAAMIGGGVDMSRAYRAQSRLQAACDAGVLAGRRSIVNDGFDTPAQQKASAFFAANFDDSSLETSNTTFVPTSADSGSTVNGVATTKLDATIMKIFGKERFNLTVNCTSTMQLSNSDITLVLDTTGSMAWYPNGNSGAPVAESRIGILKDKAKAFYDTVMTASNGNSRVRFAFVPYTSTVNVGGIVNTLNPAFIASSHNYQTRRPVSWVNPQTGTLPTSYGAETPGSFTRGATAYNTLALCTAALPADTAWVNNGSAVGPVVTSSYDTGKKITANTTTQAQRYTDYECRLRSSDGKYYVNNRTVTRDQYTGTTVTSDPDFTIDGTYDNWLYSSVPMDTSTYKTFASTTTRTGNSYANQASTWNGCIEERATVSDDTFTFVPGTGITPLAATDLNIDSAPNTADNSTKWAPMWPAIEYARTNSSGGNYMDVPYSIYGNYEGNVSCPRASQILTEMTETQFDTYIDSLYAGGSTYHDIGMIWGGRVSSPQGIWSANVLADAPNGGETARHLVFMTDGELAPDNTSYTAFGFEYHDKRITDDGTTSDYARHRSRFLAACEAVKDKGIRLWVIAFGTSLTADLQTCSSNSSSFTATDAASLGAAFQEIASQVGELRTSQ